jgi:hypothetical protein
MTDPNYHRRVLWLHRINRFNLFCYCVAFAAIVGSLAIGLGGFIVVGVRLVAVGALVIIFLTLESYLLLPFVKCPCCGHPFFRRDGLFANRVPLLNRSCLHCDLNIHLLNRTPGDPKSEGPTQAGR